jgi:hypothetical protein
MPRDRATKGWFRNLVNAERPFHFMKGDCGISG